ncbi:MAG: hypothetical protein ACXVGH_12120 [Mycobacteriales bacterium]
MGPLVRLPLTAVLGLEQTLDQLASVARRAVALLDAVEGIPARVEAVLESAEQITGRVDDVLADVGRLTGRVDEVLVTADALTTQVGAVLRKASALTGKVDGVVDDASGTLASVSPAVQALAALETDLLATLLADLAALVTGARQLDPELVDHGTASLRAVPTLMETVDQELLPALASLEGLVPVVASLGVHVDRLDNTVHDVSALLAGIPGAARLRGRGERPKA